MHRKLLAQKIFLQLVGNYSITRTIGKHSSAIGTACFTKEGSSLLYREDLKVTYHNTKTEIPAFKAYKYVLEQEELVKYLIIEEQEILFYKMHFAVGVSGIRAHGHHLCSEDLYKATYIFNNENSFILSYEVKGPQKNYQIITSYTRY